MADIVLPDTHYDAIIVGTGIEESLIAASLSRAGKRVLHLDLNDSYGGHFSTVNPSELNEYVNVKSFDSDIPEPFYQNPFTQINFKIIDGLNTSLQRKTMIDLCGLHVLYCRGPMVELLIQSGIARYLEFRCLDSVLMFDKEHSTNPFKNAVKTGDEISHVDVSQLFQTVPTTKGEVFKTKFISLKEKNRLVKFINFCVNLSTQEEEMKTYKEFEHEPFDLFLSKTQLLGDEQSFEKLRDIVVHALALLDSPIGITTQQVLTRVQYFISSLGRFGNGGAFLYPLYGQSELVQAFCRVGAVYGGVYVLRRGIHSVKLVENTHYQTEPVNIEQSEGDSTSENNDRPVIYSKEKVVVEVGSGVQTFTCDHLVVNRDSYPNDTSSTDDDLLLKYVVVTESPLFKSLTNTISVIPSGTISITASDETIVKQPCAIYMNQLDYSSCVVPRGKYMISLQTRIPSDLRKSNSNVESIVFQMLQTCVDRFVKKSIVENEETEKENIVFSTLYKQSIRKGNFSFSEELDSKIHLCNDANHDVMQLESGMTEHVKAIFKAIAGEDVEFLSKIPDPNKSDRDEEDELYDETTKLLGIEKSKVVESSTASNTTTVEQNLGDANTQQDEIKDNNNTIDEQQEEAVATEDIINNDDNKNIEQTTTQQVDNEGSNIASSSYRSNTSNSDSDEEDSKKPNKLRNSIIQSVISEARSIVEAEEILRPSIARPSRPYTPRDCERRLFIENEYTSRPTSAVSISSTFDFSHRNIGSSSGSRDETNPEVARVGSGSRKKKPSSSSSKRTGSSKSSRSDLEKEEKHEQGTSDKVWSSIDTILGSLEQCEDEDALMDSLDSILLLVDKLKTAHNPVEDEKKINFVGKLSKYIDMENGPRAVKCCSIILRVTTFGHQILHICKILFKISKQEKNDNVFKDDSIIAPLVKLLSQEFSTENYAVAWEILLFTIGTLKNISYDSYNQKLLIKHNTISLLSLLLSSALRELKTGNLEKVNKQAQLLVQIMATLRNLAMKTGTFKQFLEYNVIDNIHILMNALMSHSEFIHNSTRVLSKLSLDEICTEEMRKISTLKSCLINILKEHKKHKPIVVRVTFILGNITFQDYSDQELVDEKSEIPFLLDLLDLYSIEDERNTSTENVKKETEDLLTKLIRLIANISMDERQGRIVAQSKQVTRLIEIIERKKVQDSEELILNTLRCITNLSFYAFSDTASPLYTFRVKLASLLSPLLFHDLTDVVYEATRTFGNLSQDSSVREYITKSRIDEALIIMVEHGNTDIVYAVCGVLVNMTSDPKGIKAIQEHGAVEKLLDVLDKCNVSLALIILKIIHNICLNNEAFGENSKIYSDYDLEHLDMLLNDILNHEYDNEEMNEQEVSMLRDLSSVAQELQYILSK